MGKVVFTLFIGFFIFLLMAVPISVGLAVSSIFTALTELPFANVAYSAAQRLFAGVNGYTFLAIPFFMLAGNIMNKGGIAIRLVNLAKLFGARLPGALAHINVLSSMFFGSISGSSIAAAVAVGGILGPMQEKEGYEKSFSAAVNIAAAPTGILIPPSGPLILFSLVSGGTSVAALFIAGYIPGLMMGLAVMTYALFYSRKHDYTVDKVYSAKESLQIIVDAVPSLMLTLIIMGGILGGVFTATEAAAIAVVYTILLSLIYRTIKFYELPKIFAETMASASIILFLIACSSIMSWVMAYTGIPEAIGEAILSTTDNWYLIMLIINLTLLLVGTFMDLTPAVLIFTPIFLPIVESFGMHPVHFGIMMIFNLGLGNMTPPVGSVLFVGCQIADVAIEEVAPHIGKLMIILVVALLLIVYFPSISLFLPQVLGVIK